MRPVTKKTWIYLLLMAVALAAVALVWQTSLSPELLAFPQAEVGRREAVLLVWDRSVPESRRQLQIQPAVNYEANWSTDGTEVTLSPIDAWEWATEYSLSLNGDELVCFATQPVPTVTLFAAGDVMLDKLPGENIARHGPESVFTGMGDLVTSADISFVNLEGPVSHRGAAVANKRYTFCGKPEALEALQLAGIDVVSFANNHALDYGEEAFLDTLQHLSEYGIAYAGAGRNQEEALRPWIAEVDGLRVAFLAFGQRDFLPGWAQTAWVAGEDKPGLAMHDVPGWRSLMFEAIGTASEQAELVIVSLHWGYERHTEPFAWQRDLGKQIIDAGADAIIGHHPHLPYGVEIYKGSPIIYSLGNFLFHPYNVAQRESYVATLSLGLDGVTGLELTPILMDQGKTSILSGPAAEGILNTIATRSARLGTHLQREGDRLVWR